MTNQYELNQEQFQDCLNLAIGLFYPLEGFMNSSDYHNVTENMHLADLSIWTLPISLDIDFDTYKKISINEKLKLSYKRKCIGFIEVNDRYTVNIKKDILKIFNTNDIRHPGVNKELSKSIYRLGGKIKISDISIMKKILDPSKTKEYFKKKVGKK